MRRARSWANSATRRFFEEALSKFSGMDAETGEELLAMLNAATFFGNDAQFWMNLQSQYDLAVAEEAVGKRIAAEVERAA